MQTETLELEIVRVLRNDDGSVRYAFAADTTTGESFFVPPAITRILDLQDGDQDDFEVFVDFEEGRPQRKVKCLAKEDRKTAEDWPKERKDLFLKMSPDLPVPNDGRKVGVGLTAAAYVALRDGAQKRGMTMMHLASELIEKGLTSPD